MSTICANAMRGHGRLDDRPDHMAQIGKPTRSSHHGAEGERESYPEPDTVAFYGAAAFGRFWSAPVTINDV